MVRERKMDMQQRKTRPLTFSYSGQTTHVSPLPLDLDKLEIQHKGVKDFLSSCEQTNHIAAIYPIKISDSAASIYMIENNESVKLVLKILPKFFNDSYDLSTELALTKVSSDIFVSPRYIQLKDNFILLPYIGINNASLFNASSILRSPQSFIRVLNRLGLLHNANIIPQKLAFNGLEKLNLLALRGFDKELFSLNLSRLLEKINVAHSISALEPFSKNSVFVHANINPLNIVEDSQYSYLIDWAHAGQGNPYFDLGAVFSMYALDDALKLQLIRAHYPNTMLNKLPEEDNLLLKELYLYSAIYWLNLALTVMNTNVLDRRQSLLLIGSQCNHHIIEPAVNQQMNLLTLSAKKELTKNAIYEAQTRIDMLENLNYGNKLSL